MSYIQDFLSHSVARRTAFLVCSIMTVIFMIGGYLQINHTSNIVAKSAHRQANRSMEGAIKVIDNRISTVETAVETAASYAYMMAPNETLGRTLMQRLIEANEDIAAVTLMYRADYFPKHGRYYAPTISRDPFDGTLVEEEIGGPEHDFCYLETDSNWVYTNKLDHGYWCLPYIDSMSTKRAMVTYSVPLHDTQGETYAILCADIDLNWVKEVVESAKPYDYSQVFVIGRDSQYICHPKQVWVESINAISQAQKINNTEMLHTTQRMLRWQRGVDTIEAMMFFGSNYQEEYPGRHIVFYAPISRVQWSLCFTIPEAKIMEHPNRLRHNLMIILIVLLVVIALMLRYIIHAQLKPLADLAASAKEVAKGDFNAKLPKIDTKDELRNLRDSFENMQTSLSDYIVKLKETTSSKAAIESELHVASDIQMSMLPKEFKLKSDDKVEIFGQLTPAKAVGGDLFDFYIYKKHLYFCIGDVSGKGVPAALVMAVTQALFRSISAHETAPDRIITKINTSLAKRNQSNMFVTMFVGVLDLSNGHIHYCNAGHNSPFLIKGKEVVTLSCDPNLPCGILDDWHFSLQETDLPKDSTIFLFTDGLSEAENIDYQQFGEDRITAIAKQQSDHPQQLITAMTCAVSDFVGKAEQSDDLTMLAIKYKSI